MDTTLYFLFIGLLIIGLYVFIALRCKPCKCSNIGSKNTNPTKFASLDDDKHVLYNMNSPRLLGCPFSVNKNGVTRFFQGGHDLEYILDIPNKKISINTVSLPLEIWNDGYSFKDNDGTRYNITSIQFWKNLIGLKNLDC